MRPIRSLILYLLAVFGGAALMAPLLHAGVLWLVDHQVIGPALAKQPFHRYVNRALLTVAILGLWPFVKSLGFKSWKDLGFQWREDSLRQLGLGLLLGLGSLAIIAGLSLVFGVRSYSHPTSSIAGHLLNALLSAFAVGLLEEILFRGALFGALNRVYSCLFAVGVSSLIYALVHFLSKPPSPEVVEWSSGFALLPRMLRGTGDPMLLAPRLLNLTLAGAILAVGFYRSRSLYLGIGLHAGWIFWLKSYGFFTKTVSQDQTWIWGKSQIIEGWLAFPILGLLLVLVAKSDWFLPRSAVATANTPSREKVA